MALFKPNQKCKIYRPSGLNAYGEEIINDVQETKCTFVLIGSGAVAQQLRTDTSASNGAAQEVVHDQRIFFPPDIDVRIGDKVVAAGKNLRVESIKQMFDLRGRLDYLDVGLITWSGR